MKKQALLGVCFTVVCVFPAFSQTYFTVPQNVWRFTMISSQGTGKWIGPKGQEGIIGQPVSLPGYGKRYFDHEYVNSDGYYSSPYDLFDLDTIYINTTRTIGQAIRDFNNNTASFFGFDTLPDYRSDFFGPEAVQIGGKLSEFRSRVIAERQVKVEYGATNRVTFKLSVPYITRLEENRSWKWKPGIVPGLSEWLSYHREARARFDSLFVNPLYYGIDEITRSNLETVYQRLYTWEGKNSVLWALEGGTDPLGNGFFGTEYNPFAEDDTTRATIYDLLNYYYPAKRQSSGLGDVTLELNFLLAGIPAWRASGSFSVYGGVQIQLPSGRQLRKFHPGKTDSDGRPSQFSELPIGTGVTSWRFSLFGEFYRWFKGRLFNLNWYSQIGISNREYLYTPVSFLGLNVMHQDSIVSIVGEQYYFRPGMELNGALEIKLGIVPEKITVSAGVTGWFKGRDTFLSRSDAWDNWMVKHDGFDTRYYSVNQTIKVYLHNIDPLKKIGPFPFEMEVGLQLPVINRNIYSITRWWIGFTTYYQAW